MKNVNILLFLSKYTPVVSKDNPKGVKCEEYRLKNWVKPFKGTQTNDAPVRYMFERAKSEGGCIKRILCITSHDVYTKPDDIPQFKRFKCFVNELSKEYNMQEPDFIPIPYDYDELSKEKKDYGEQLPNVIYSKLSDCFKEVIEKEEVYIDYTGGLRDISFLMTSIIRFLEYKGLRCGEIVYSNYFDKKLYDIHYIYDLYQVINGVNEFTNTGNAHELEKVYKMSDDSPVGKLINSLIAFSDALSICAIGGLDEKVNDIVGGIRELENYKSNDIRSAMLKTLAPVIREKMYLQEGFDYPKMIRWCAENNMIQQAATIYTDKMPKYYFDKHMVPDYVDLTKVKPTPGHGLYDTGFYTELFDRAAEGIEIAIFREDIITISNCIDDFMDRAKSIACISREQSSNKEIKPVINRAFNRLTDFINKSYKKDGFLKENVPEDNSQYQVYIHLPDDAEADWDGYVKKSKKIPKNLKEFWVQLKSQDNYWHHTFLYNDEEDYLAIATPSKCGADKTFRKKVHAIQKIKNGKVLLSPECDTERTYKIMAYYLAVKVMRNRMNHAGESVRTNDEMSAIRSLNSLGIGIKYDDNIHAYKRILLGGLKYI